MLTKTCPCTAKRSQYKQVLRKTSRDTLALHGHNWEVCKWVHLVWLRFETKTIKLVWPVGSHEVCVLVATGSSGGSWAAAQHQSGADQSASQPHFSVSFAVMNNYQAAAAAAQGFGPPASPHAAAAAANARSGFPAANSPGPAIDMYNGSAADSVGYVQAASPQPSTFPAIAVSRAPLNYSPVSTLSRSF